MAMSPRRSGKTLWQVLPPALRQPAHAGVGLGGITLDSRKVEKGHLFVALAGGREDGRRFIAQAVANGCAAVVAEAAGLEEFCPEHSILRQQLKNADISLVPCPDLALQVSAIAARFYGEPAEAMTVIGVTGTNGKTTCASLISQFYSILDGRSGLIGTLGCGPVVDGVAELEETGMTTPDGVSLQHMLAVLRDGGARAVAMEVSSHSLDQHRVDAAGIDCAVFTNLSRDHLDYHGDEEGYGRAKAKLFRLPGVTSAVINGDDSFGRRLLAELSADQPAALKVYSYGLDPARDIHAQNIELSSRGIAADIITPWGRGRLESTLLGEFNLFNLLAVTGAVCASGADFPTVLRVIPRLQPVSGRMDVVSPRTRPVVVIDYAHTPDALEKALLALRSHCQGNLWCVFGCGGDRDQGKRPLMGAVAEQFADRVVVTSDNPRTEVAEDIIRDILAGIANPETVSVDPDRSSAIRAAILGAAKEDTILIAGKGHENYQQIGNDKFPFNDRDEAMKSLQLRGKTAGGETP